MPQDKHSQAELLALFPPIEPYASAMLELDAPHRMYYEESGNPRGVPVVFLHGGPGAGASAVHRQFFDPRFYRIVVFDQRGAGRSAPLGCLDNNTTPHLVEDMERLRQKLGVEAWLVLGGSLDPVPRRHRAGALRHRLPGGLRGRPAPRVARSRIYRCPRCGPLGVRAGHPLAAGRGHGAIQGEAVGPQREATMAEMSFT